MSDLTPKQQRFVEEYIVDLNATQAAIRAGYSAKTANEQGCHLLANVSIQAKIEASQQESSRRTEITADQVLTKWWAIANADPNALIQHRRGPCRYCNGKNHAFQWKTPREFEAATAEATAREMPPPTDKGGYGYSSKAEIDPDCPECAGDGIGYIVAADTRGLANNQLYAGVKQTKEGLEMKLRDQDKALDNVARHLGLFKNDAPAVSLNGITFQLIS
jgi:phage terminase small subunit